MYGRRESSPPQAATHRRDPVVASAADHRLLMLQRAAGNRAVGQLMGVQRDARADADRSARLMAAVGRDDLESVGTILQEGDRPWILQRLQNMSLEQLRLLDDAMRRG